MEEGISGFCPGPRTLQHLYKRGNTRDALKFADDTKLAGEEIANNPKNKLKSQMEYNKMPFKSEKWKIVHLARKN